MSVFAIAGRLQKVIATVIIDVWVFVAEPYYYLWWNSGGMDDLSKFVIFLSTSLVCIGQCWRSEAATSGPHPELLQHGEYIKHDSLRLL